MMIMPSNMTPADPPPTLFTVPEAAWVCETEDKFVNREVDRKVVQVSLTGKRLFARWDLVYFRAIREIGSSVNVDLRRKIYQRVRENVEAGNLGDVHLGAFLLRCRAIISQVNKRTHDINAARDSVQVLPNVRHGETVVLGTRITVRLLGSLAKQGVTVNELASNYDLSPRQVDLALLYDKLHPRRGRPVASQGNEGLADLGEVLRTDVEELGVYEEP